MFFALAALLLPLSASAVMVVAVPRDEEIHLENCAALTQTYFCERYYPASTRGNDPSWGRFIEKYRASVKASPDCEEGELKVCQDVAAGVLEDERKLVCPKCRKLALLKRPSVGPAPSALDPEGPAAPGGRPPASGAPGGSTHAAPSAPQLGKPTSIRSSVTGTPCEGGAAECFSDAGRTNRQGLTREHERKVDADEGSITSRDHTADSLSAATKFLQRIKSKMGNDASPATKGYLDSDQRLVSKATAALGPDMNGSFTPNDALGAHFGSVRSTLLAAAFESRQLDDFQKVSAEAEKAENQLRGLALEADQHAVALGSVESGVSAPSATPAPAAAKAGSITDSGVSLLGDSGRGAKAVAAPATAKEPLPEAKAAPVSGGGKGAAAGANDSPYSLRDKLKRDLKKHSEVLDSPAFGAGGLDPVPGKPGVNVAGAKVPELSATEEILSAAFHKGRTGAGFALGSSAETEAELKRLQQDSFPAAESPSLFDRVHQAHRACEQRSCVVRSTP